MFYLLDCVLLTSTPTPTLKPTPYNNAKNSIIVVQCDKNYAIDVHILSRSCWCAQAGHQMSLCVEHMACCLLVPCYLIIVSVAPAVSPLLPSFVSLYSSPCVCSPVLIRCLSCVFCYM